MLVYLGWRDFYSHVLAAYPHVSMGRPFQEKYADIKWETDQAKFDAWKDGMTGYPIVDAVRFIEIHHFWYLICYRLCVSSRFMVCNFITAGSPVPNLHCQDGCITEPE